MIFKKKKEDVEILASIRFMIEYLEVENSIIKQKIALNPQFYDKIDSEMSHRDENHLQSAFKWTANPIDLVEVIESLLQLGCINKGNVVRSSFYNFIGQIFDVNLSKHSGKMYKICNRPDNINIQHKRIHFLPKMMQALSERILELEDK